MDQDVDKDVPCQMSRSQQRARISRLALGMSTAATDGEAFRLAGDTCYNVFDGICFVSLAIVTKDGDLNHFKLNATCNASHSHLGTLRVLGTAAGFAVHTKEIVSTGDISRRTPAFTDWIGLKAEESAVSMISAPLVLADTAIGCITLASTNFNAFQGQHLLVEMLAAVLAPYLGLQKFRKELKAIEGVLHQMVPMKVALRLTEMQAQAVNQPPAFCTDQSPFARNSSKGDPSMPAAYRPTGRQAAPNVQLAQPSFSALRHQQQESTPGGPSTSSACAPMSSIPPSSLLSQRHQTLHRQVQHQAGDTCERTSTRPAYHSMATADAGPGPACDQHVCCTSAATAILPTSSQVHLRQSASSERCYQTSMDRPVPPAGVMPPSPSEMNASLSNIPTTESPTSPVPAASFSHGCNGSLLAPAGRPVCVQPPLSSSNRPEAPMQMVLPILLFCVAVCVKFMQPDLGFTHGQRYLVSTVMIAAWMLLCMLWVLSSVLPSMNCKAQLVGVRLVRGYAGVLYAACQHNWLSHLPLAHSILMHTSPSRSAWIIFLDGFQLAVFGLLLSCVLGVNGSHNMQARKWLSGATLHVVLSVALPTHLALLAAVLVAVSVDLAVKVFTIYRQKQCRATA